MSTLKRRLTTAVLLGIISTSTFAEEAQKAPPPQKPADSATMPGCPGMGGMGMGTMAGKGMHGMTGSQAMGQDMMTGMPMGMGMGMMRPGMMMAGTPAMVDERLAALKTELAITDAEAEVWNAYASAVKNRASTMQNMHASMMQAMQSGTAPDRVDVHIKHMTAMLEAMKALKPATEDLYRVLNAEQKKKADTLLGAGCGMM
jgi:hypothetical protein